MSVPLVLKILQPRVLVSLLVLIDKLDTQMKITAATFSPDSTEFKEAERPSLQLKATLLYLVAMRKIYVEYGMSDTPIKSEHDPRFVGLVSGLRFFKIWCSDWLRIGPHIAKTTKNRHFLAHISWTELRIHGVATLEYGIRTLARGGPFIRGGFPQALSRGTSTSCGLLVAVMVVSTFKLILSIPLYVSLISRSPFFARGDCTSSMSCPGGVCCASSPVVLVRSVPAGRSRVLSKDGFCTLVSSGSEC